MSKQVLVVKNLNMHYETLDGPVAAVKDVSFVLNEGESFGLVGESGCGKTSVAMSLLQLQADNAKISSGSIKLEGKVVAVGGGAKTEDGKLIPMDVKVGDKVLFGKWSGTEVKINGKEYSIMKESDIMGISGK